MASHVRVLGGAPDASICLRIFWSRMAFFCRFRALRERTNGRNHAYTLDGWFKSLGGQSQSVQRTSLCKHYLARSASQNTAPEV